MIVRRVGEVKSSNHRHWLYAACCRSPCCRPGVECDEGVTQRFHSRILSVQVTLAGVSGQRFNFAGSRPVGLCRSSARCQMVCAFCRERSQESIPMGITENGRDHASLCCKAFACNSLDHVAMANIALEAATPKALHTTFAHCSAAHAGLPPSFFRTNPVTTVRIRYIIRFPHGSG